MRRVCMLLRNCGKPTIAMVRGWCIGGGNEWQIYCDLCVASEMPCSANPERGSGRCRSSGQHSTCPFSWAIGGPARCCSSLSATEPWRRRPGFSQRGRARRATRVADGRVVRHDQRSRSRHPSLHEDQPQLPGDLHYPSWIHGSELLNVVWNNQQSVEGMTAFKEKRPPDFSRFPR